MLDLIHVPCVPRPFNDLADCAAIILVLVTAEAFMFVGHTVELLRGRPFETAPGPRLCSKAFCMQQGFHEVERWWGPGVVCSDHHTTRAR